MSANQGMCPLFKCTAGAFKQHLKICFADFQSITALNFSKRKNDDQQGEIRKALPA